MDSDKNTLLGYSSVSSAPVDYKKKCASLEDENYQLRVENNKLKEAIIKILLKI